MKILKINQQNVETLTQPVKVSDITFLDNESVIESSQLSSKFPDVNFGGDFLQDRVYIVTEEKSPDQILAELKSRNNKILIQPSSEVSDSNSKITKLEKEIADFQSQKDKLSELENSISEKESQLNNINHSLESSKILIENRAAVVEKINAVKSKIQSSAQKSTDSILNDRRTRIDKFLKGVKKRSDIVLEEKSPGIYPPLKILLIITLLNFAINLFFYITSFQFSILIISILSLTVLLFNAFMVNIFRPLYTKDIKAIEEIISSKNNPEYKFTDDDHVLINNAWMNAYSVELKRLDDILSQNLQGKDYKQLESDVVTIANDVEKTKTALEDAKSSTLSTEEYYKKRRELDILKIEMENSTVLPVEKSAPPQLDVAHLPFIIFDQTKNPQIKSLENDYIMVVPST